MFRSAIAGVVFVAMTALPSWALDLDAPKGEVVLTVSGMLDVRNVEETAQFDLEMLAAMKPTTIETSTLWTEGKHKFEGVALVDLVQALGLKGSNLRALAINDYQVDIPMTDAVANGPIIAYKMDGEPMSVREKGPLWVIYPYDSSSEYRSEVIYSRSIWQLDRIEAVE